MPFGSMIASAAASYAQGSLQTALGGTTRAVVYAGNKLLPNQALDWGDYIFQWRMGFINEPQFRKESKELGYDVTTANFLQFQQTVVSPQSGRAMINQTFFEQDYNPIEKQLWLAKRVPSPEEALTLLNRGLISNSLARFYIAHNFDGETVLANKYLELKDQIPGPSDLVRFAVRDCFTPEIVSTFGYAQELPTAILPYMAAQGFGGRTTVNIPAGSTTTEGPETRTRAQWFDLFWWSHWELPSVGQGYEMLQRLYPTSRYGPSPYANASTYFGINELELLQKANDYPPYWRARLQAISYNPLTRVDIRRMYGLGVLKEDNNNHEVFHAYRQIGYNDVDAERLVLFTKRDRLKGFAELAVRQIDTLYKNGGYNERQARDALKQLFYTDADVDAHILILKVQIGNEGIATVTKLMHRAFAKGHYSRAMVRDEFDKINLDVEVGDRLLSQWQLEKQTKYKDLTTAKILDAVKRGIVTVDDAKFRLGNFGYTDADINIMLQILQQQILIAQQQAQVKAIAGAKKQAEKTAKEQAKAVKETAKAAAKRAKDLADARKAFIKAQLAAYTDKNIVAFYKGGFLSQDNVAEILYAKGWDDVAVNAYIQDLNSSSGSTTSGTQENPTSSG